MSFSLIKYITFEAYVDEQVKVEIPSKQNDIENYPKHEEEDASHSKEYQINENHHPEQVISDIQKGVGIRPSL